MMSSEGVWEARVFSPVKGENKTRTELVLRSLCERLRVRYSENSAEKRTDIYLVGPNPDEGSKFRCGDLDFVETKVVTNRTVHGAERMLKRVVNANRFHVDPNCKKVHVSKRRYAEVGEREVTLLILNEEQTWISLCIEGKKMERSDQAVVELRDLLVHEGFPAGEIDLCSYSRWLYNLCYKEGGLQMMED